LLLVSSSRAALPHSRRWRIRQRRLQQSAKSDGGRLPHAAGVAPRGHIVVAQAKLTIPVKGSGVKVPLSVTASNRTELIKARDVRANVGITFDLDTLLPGALGGK
jgi:hypothetical protein